MTVDTSPVARALVDFLREEAPLEYERLQSISDLVSAPPDVSGDRSDLSQAFYARWVRGVLGPFAT
jgi:hypothetical protein